MPFVLALLLALLPTQSPEPKAIPKDSVEVSTRGCLKGRVFTAMYIVEDEGTRRGPDVDGRQFRVTGKRDVMDIVKKHNGERVEVVGIVRRSALSDEGVGMRIGGRTRVVIGAQGGDPTRMNQRIAAPGVAVMDLVAVRSLGQRCPIQ
jgi:hypothetical protein